MREYELPIMIFKEDDGHYYPRESGGCNKLIVPSKCKNIIEDLIRYYNIYDDYEIQLDNEKAEKDFFKNWVHNMKPYNNKYGFVYVLRCANKYKIGYSKDVQRRIKQLDTRPFKLELVFECYSNKAYDIEQTLHKTLTEYKDDGEWYNSTIESVDLKELIKEIAEDIGCDIQF